MASQPKTSFLRSYWIRRILLIHKLSFPACFDNFVKMTILLLEQRNVEYGDDIDRYMSFYACVIYMLITFISCNVHVMYVWIGMEEIHVSL